MECDQSYANGMESLYEYLWKETRTTFGGYLVDCQESYGPEFGEQPLYYFRLVDLKGVA
jgi:hypothetical protein